VIVNGWEALNGAKVARVVHHLLEKYHRDYGLAAIGWARPVGATYFRFHSRAICEPDGPPRFFAELSADMPLTMCQGYAAIPVYREYDLLTPPGSNELELPLGELVAWYEEHLALGRLFTLHEAEVAEWRRGDRTRCEPFLLTWNVLSQVASATGAPILTFDHGESGMTALGRDPAVVAAELGHVESSDVVHFCGPLTFSTEGRVLTRDGAIIDIWQQHHGGTAPRTVAQSLVATMIRG
jgi:hypothetical protein